jgi:uncharacterized membrane protein SpoIIM required for sporulation
VFPYVDPGTGSLVIQGLISILAIIGIGGAALASIYYTVRRAVRRELKDRDNPDRR